MFKRTAVIAMTLLAGACGQAWAIGSPPSYGLSMPTPYFASPTPGQSVITSRGPAFITGHLGSMETTTVPGSGGQGFLMNNGNGTSTLILPGAAPQTLSTPR